MSRPKLDHQEVAAQFLERADTAPDGTVRWFALGAALVHALFDIANAIRERGRS